MFQKIARYFNTDKMPVQALNKPDWAEINFGQVKFASIDKAQDVDLDSFDIEAAIKENPEHLFIKVFAIKKDEVNDNGDAFPEDELIKAAHTFIGVPVFTNHQNSDIEKAKGRVVHAWYDKKKGGIWIISSIDKVAYPQIARGVEEGYINGTSMGAQVQYSLCSVCHNKAHTADEYCSHVRNQKNKKVSQKVKCAFHDSKCNPDDESCPVCGCKKGESKHHELKQAQVFEWNYGIKFIEDSLVVNPACHECTIDCVLNVPVVQTKLSKLHQSLKSMADNKTVDNTIRFANASGEVKTSGKIELEKLNEAVGLLEVVARSMMDQKQQVSLEYVSDLLDVMATAQETIDELTEMGYAGLASPPTISQYLANNQTTGASAIPQGQAAPQQQQQPQAPHMAPPSGGTPDMGGMATVTKPTFKASSEEKKQEIVTAEANGRKSIDELRRKLAEAIEERNAAQTKESEVMANENTTKTAAGAGQTEYSQQVITEKVLEDKKNASEMLHPRTETHPTGTTQSDEQLGKGKSETDVTSKSPQVRFDNPPEEITEAQMAAIKGDEIVRHGDFPEVITEKQWESMHREVGAVLSEDQANHITQAQLRDLLSNHTWTEPAPDTVTEDQLAQGGFGKGGNAGNLDRLNSDGIAKAASYDATKLVAAATEAIADAIASYSKSPDEIVKAASAMNRTPQSVIKASYLMLVNAVPQKKAARKESRNRNAYFAKKSSDLNSSVKPIDALTACLADHCTGLKAEDLIEAVGFVASQKSVMAQVDAKVQSKLASADEVEVAPVVDKFAALKDAIASIESENDGRYQVHATIAEVGVPVTNKKAFVQAAIKLASNEVASELPAGVEVTPLEVRVNEKDGIVAITLKDNAKLTIAEQEMLSTRKSAAAKADLTKRAGTREQIVKEAQFGGGMPDQMGAAPGAAGGAMPPAAGGAGAQPPAPGVESFDQNPVGEDDLSDTTDMEAKAPGSICPVCSSEDIDIVEGKGKCKNCSAEFTYKVQIDVNKWPNTLDKGESDGEEGGELGDEGKGFAMPEQGGADASIPVAAMTRIDKNMVTKLAAIKGRVVKASGNQGEMALIALPVKVGGMGISIANQETIAKGDYMLGNISPLTGSTNTVKLAGNAHMCLDTGTPYIMETAVGKDDPSKPYVQWKWIPKVAGNECTSCNRVKKAFVDALKLIGKTEADFNSTFDYKSRGEIILAMKKAGAFAQVKTASTAINALGEFKKAYAMPASKFPVEMCREKIARRFGENAVAMCGPCEGQNLADCVCNQLKKAEVYSNALAIKVASVWNMPDPNVVCLEKFVRENFSLKEAATCCEALKMRYAQAHEHFLEDLGSNDDMGGDVPPTDGGDVPPSGDDVDPFDGGGEGFDSGDGGLGGDVPPTDGAPTDGAPASPDGAELTPTTVTGPEPTAAPMAEVTPAGNVVVNTEVLQALETLDSAIDKARGEDTSAEPHHDLPSGASAEVPMGQAEGLEQAVEPVLDQAAESPDAGGEETPEFGEEKKDDSDPFGGEAKEPVSDETSFDSDNNGGDAMETEEKEKEAFASAMKSSTISPTGKIRMDLSSVVAAIKAAKTKVASEEGKTVQVQQAQDSVGKVQNGGTLGNESKFTAEKPEVPSNESKSKMGHENPPSADLPKVPTGDQRLGHEEGHLKPELGNKVTGLGGSEGEVVASAPYKGSTKDIAYKLAMRIKEANEKKVDNHVPTMETEGFGKIRDGKTHPHGNEKPFDAQEPEIPEKNKGSFMGHEEESIHDVPKATSEFAPTVPTEGKADKVDEVKGTVIASGDVKSTQEKEAFRIAGRMLADGLLSPDQLLPTVAELRDYKVAMLKAYEQKLFTTAKTKVVAKKGLDTVSDGAEQHVVNYNNSMDVTPKPLTRRIAEMFTLSKQAEAADNPNLSDAEVRKTYRR